MKAIAHEEVVKRGDDPFEIARPGGFTIYGER
jgi:hypothetical protein